MAVVKHRRSQPIEEIRYALQRADRRGTEETADIRQALWLIAEQLDRLDFDRRSRESTATRAMERRARHDNNG